MSEITVVKIGGNEIDDPEWLAAFAQAIARHPAKVVVVHGGGKEISRVQNLLGGMPTWREGLRVTTNAAMRATSMALSGLVNKRVVSALLTAGVDALGISGEDAALLQARQADEGRLGRVGEIEKVRVALLTLLLDKGYTPVISPVSRGADGGAINVNADDVAASIAIALEAAELLMISNVPGIRHGEETLLEIQAGETEDLIASGAIAGGMIVKVRAGTRAAGRGVVAVRVGGPEMLDDGTTGTRVSAEGAAAIAASCISTPGET